MDNHQTSDPLTNTSYWLTSLSYFDGSFWSDYKEMYIMIVNHANPFTVKAGSYDICTTRGIIVPGNQSRTLCLVKHGGHMNSVWTSTEVI